MILCQYHIQTAIYSVILAITPSTQAGGGGGGTSPDGCFPVSLVNEMSAR